jgi:hypothetical protein
LGPIVAEALPVSAGLAAAIAVMVTAVGLGIVVGAVYAPKVEMVPIVEFPPAIPFTCQLTLALVLPVTLAWKVCGVPAGTIAVDGVTVTVTVGKGVGPPPPPPPPQAIRRPRSPAASMEKPHAFIHARSLGKHPWFRYFTPLRSVLAGAVYLLVTSLSFCCLVPLRRYSFPVTLILTEIGHPVACGNRSHTRPNGNFLEQILLELDTIHG